MQLGRALENLTLNDISESVIDAGRLLDEMTKPERLECLQVYAQCQGVVTWIKHMGKGTVVIITDLL